VRAAGAGPLERGQGVCAAHDNAAGLGPFTIQERATVGFHIKELSFTTPG